ncbi:MAG: methionine biosynthesis protein MetW [Alphaproteobacteria bacterium]|nr:methionine biosynthesis protein MetW [Alphaproteobacteria bacterium]
MNRIQSSPQIQNRIDLQRVADMIEPGSRVLDVGCGDGALLDYLVHFKQVDGRGIELSQEGVNRSVSLGLAVVQGDAEIDLQHYPSDAFDYVILSQTLQSIYDVRGTLRELLRISRHAIVSFPNLGYWRVRFDLLVRGRSPMSEKLPYIWCDSPNIRFCTLTDFVTLAGEMGFEIDRIISIDHSGRAMPRDTVGRWTNWLAEEAIYLLSREVSPDSASQGSAEAPLPAEQ